MQSKCQITVDKIVLDQEADDNRTLIYEYNLPRTGKIKLPNNQPITQLKNLKDVAMPTLDLPVDPKCRYDDFVYVHGFDPGFKLAGGINLPKILTCIGSDGVERRQLVKVSIGTLNIIPQFTASQ